MAENVLSPCLMFMITNAGTEKKIERLLFDVHLPFYLQCRGQGTASSELLNICGLSGRTRLVTVSVLPGAIVPELFERLRRRFVIEKKGTGIALTIPMLGIQEMMMKSLPKEGGKSQKERVEERMNQDAEFAMLLVSVKEGYSDEVIDAANAAGGKGGTVLRGRRRGSEELVQFLGISLQEAQELILMVVPREKKMDIMNAVNAACGLKSPAQGTILAVPVDNIVGLAK